ncbi:hypothetical protein [Leptolyngbya sp. FACHB-711]|jgi:hypothetical protein|uniref:hypothetical protein n=1 Tax=unclassified Leptolyngbya TaxID=2650499 RepID=UPI0016843028|nr:hypothetical protein [Leptolyngbya sp. FACHB-711]MBD1850721.1 hypothetical protein [Cyanobacteria bacterium FACHB-502]MBD2026804.1 hypothetical protein [Leptolyngbya sp. FACHB-711]
MSLLIHVEPHLAQAKPATPASELSLQQIWMATSGILTLLLIGLAIYNKIRTTKLEKQRRFEEFKNRELQKKLKLALGTISKMERNPDLIHSREFNLDYLRMRMEEEQFHFTIVNQIKIRVKEKITIALRPSQADNGIVGIASATGRMIDEIFDVEYDPSGSPVGTNRRVLFRIQIKLAKLPTQPTSTTIAQIIECMEKYMSQGGEENWQPTIQGRIATMHWDQKAKPTPLLVLEQSNEGVNVTFRTQRIVNNER